MIYKWQENSWKQLIGRLGRLPHALLLAGPQGSGKEAFAHAFAARLVCENAHGADFACGNCLPCGWFASGNHPDFRLIEPGGGESLDDKKESALEPASKKSKSEQIRIDQIRALEDFLAVGTHRQGARIVVIQPAEAMNPATANALLKVLEEPTSSTLFILISHNQRRLLPTVRSRCQVIVFPKPGRNEALGWLHQQKTPRAEEFLDHVGGMPLAAAAEAENADRLDQFASDLASIDRIGPGAIAARWESWLKSDKEGAPDMDKRILVSWLQKWIYDLIAIKLAGQAKFHKCRLEQLRAASAVPTTSLIDCYNELLRIRAVAQHPLNPRLFLEDMLARYVRALASGNSERT